MIFKADDEAINDFLEYFQFGNLLFKTGMFVFCGAVVVIAYFYDGMPALLFMSAWVSVVAYGNLIRPFFSKVKLLHRLVKTIEFKGDELSISTIEIDIYWDLIKRVPISLTMSADGVLVKIANEKYGVPEYTGRIWLLFYKGQEYLLAEKFFSDFESLMSQLKAPYEVDC
jgi:hypothetical protein